MRGQRLPRAIHWLAIASSLAPLAEAQALTPAAAMGSRAISSSDGVLMARGGGGGGGRSFGGGGRSFGGGGSRGDFDRGGGNRANNGFNGAGGGLTRGSNRPSGGWSNQVKFGDGGGFGSGGGPSLDRGSWSGQNGGFRGTTNRTNGYQWNGNGNRSFQNDGNRNWGNRVNINNVNVNAGWARPGWGLARPWNTGWYGGWSTPAWGWWGAQAAAWGISTLATAAVINNGVNQAINANNDTYLVPDSNYALYYGSIQPSGPSSVNFVVQDGGSNYQLSADCNAGTINGQNPQSAAQAQLLNAACQVAFGSA